VTAALTARYSEGGAGELLFGKKTRSAATWVGLTVLFVVLVMGEPFP
jgi:hypothetical protein